MTLATQTERFSSCNLALDSPGQGEVDGLRRERVELFKALYEPWNERRLILDSVNPLDENIQSALSHVGFEH